MKSLFQFLSEAVATAASKEAKEKHGLVYNSSKSAWVSPKDPETPVARTIKGKLEFVDRKKGGQPEVKATTARKKEEPAKQRKVAVAGGEEEKGGEEETVEGSLTVAFGRFNPPTTGHGKLLAAAKSAAGDGDLEIYPSRTQDPKKNPLDPDMKVSYMKKMFPEFEENIVNNPEMKSIFNVLMEVNEKGYTTIKIVVGSDRQAEFENLANKYNGELYEFEEIEVISAGQRDADSEGVEGMSASKMRKAVVDGDFAAFRRGVPKTLKDQEAQELFNSVASAMKIKQEKVAEMWEIAPKYDPRGLRENYFNGFIYQIGDLVENLNTGLIGKIVRRGTNHLICVTQEGYLFKSWIKDLNEVYEYATNSYREYVQRLTPREKVRSFINKSTKNRNAKRK